mmetsp:Transcript_14867/g.36362  ORF Transcript_14867/g.36362 Transcript_14867/m.36362 type:complete len:83 (+) Transcript_14867:5141-5389(+)
MCGDALFFVAFLPLCFLARLDDERGVEIGELIVSLRLGLRLGEFLGEETGENDAKLEKIRFARERTGLIDGVRRVGKLLIDS